MGRAFLLLALLLASCSTFFIDPLEQLREANKRNLDRVSVGHTRFEVESIMGRERAGGRDGATYEVLFYYTDVYAKDDKITDDELTPVVLRDGKVVAVGHAFLGAIGRE